ncbi:MAG: type II toxin-antitoxin system VapC family toxin [Bilifractor sp.]
MRIYLDNCCYNRPYDDQSQLSVHLESEAKLQIQSDIRNGRVDLAASYILSYEISKSPWIAQREAIREFVKNNAKYYVDKDLADEAESIAVDISKTGVKQYDAYHVACAILAKCDCFLTTDRRLLKYSTNRIEILDPIDFIQKYENL